MGVILRVLCAVVALALSLTAAPSTVAAAAPAPRLQGDEVGAAGAVPPPGLGLSPEVARLPASSPDLDRAAATLRELEQQRDDQTRRLEQDDRRLRTERRELLALDSLLERRAAQLDKAAAAEQRTAEALAALTIDRFVEGDHLLEGLDPALSADRRTELARQMVLGSVATDRLVRERAHHTSRLASLRSERDALRERADRLRSDVTRLESSTAELTASLEQLGPRIVEAQQRRDQARMSASIDGTDMSTIALDAYWRAEQHLSLIDPDCGVTWWVLAGIGRTESLHGTYRGARVAVDGMVSPPIYGPDLDGSNDFAVVRDSDGGRLDGTARTDRAVGPMQFLPGTWRAVSIDLDLDGVADPQNLFDAAASAGAYLCRSGPRLTEREALRAALLTYNRSWAYVDLVEERGREYATAVPLP